MHIAATRSDMIAAVVAFVLAVVAACLPAAADAGQYKLVIQSQRHGVA